MNRTPRILPAIAFYFSLAIFWLAALPPLAAADSAGSKPGVGNATDYVMSYMIVVLAIVLGLLVVCKASVRRERERPAGYVEKNIMGDDH